MNTDFRFNITCTVSRVHCNGLCTVSSSVPASSKVCTTTCFTGLLAAAV